MGLAEEEAEERGFKNMHLKPMLMLTYGGIVCGVFSIVLIISATMIYTLAARVLSESEDALMDQITSNTEYILAESADVFVKRLDFGVHVLALPAAYSVYDVLQRSTYSVAAPTTYLDSSHSTLQQPTSSDDRYPCDMSESSALRSKRGCTASDLKAISPDASALYITGLRYDGSNGASLLSSNQAGADLTAHSDHFVGPAWDYIPSAQGWMGAYVALDAGGLLRTYPGFVGDLSPGSGTRSYNPTTRPWFTEHSSHSFSSTEKLAMTNAGQSKYRVVYSEPYVSRDGNGNLVAANLAIHDDSGTFRGVAGTDVKVDALQDIVANIRLGTDGTVHLYHSSSARVAASPQWREATSDSDYQLVDEIKIVPGDAGSPTLSRNANCGGTEDVGDQIIIRKSVLGGRYCIAAVVPESEIIAPIKDQEDDINATANALFITSLLVLLACLFGLVVPCALCVSIQMSTPLMKTSKETQAIANNIGGDLFKGVDVERPSSQVGPVEVAKLREGFMHLLWKLKRKREATIPPLNPCYRQLQAPAVPELKNVRVRKGDPHYNASSVVSMSPEITGWNRVSLRLALQLILPMVVALLIIIIVTSVSMFSSVDTWVTPVKDKMIETELEMLDMRAYERALLVQEIIATYETQLIAMKDYTQKLYSGELTTGTPYSTNAFSPLAFCPTGATSCVNPNGILQSDQVRGSRQVSFDYSVWYVSEGTEAAVRSSLATPSGQVISDSTSAVSEFEGRATNLENMLRVAYYASESTDVFFGFEPWEGYMGYPYAKLDSYERRQQCEVQPSSYVSAYTVLCRKWYYNAKQPSMRDQVVYNDVGMSSITGQPFVSLTTACYTTSNKLIGVVGIDLNLGALKSILRNTPLYNDGRAYLFDAQGYTIIHPDLDESQEGARVPISTVVSGEDMNFKGQYEEKVVANFGQTGTAIITWANPDTDEDENWHYSYLAAGPYQLVVGVVDRDVQEAANELQSAMNTLTTVHTVLTTIFFVLASAALIFVSYKFQGKFVDPLIRLINFLQESERTGYAQQVEEPRDVWSHELRSVLKNMRKLLVAVRFGNPEYHQGDKERELGNLRNALRIVTATENVRGIGVCLNNRGLCIRGMAPDMREKSDLTAEEKDIESTLTLAVQNARQVVAQGEVDVSEDTIGGRLLTLALAKLEVGKVDECVRNLEEAMGIHKKTGSWTSFARMANVLNTVDLETHPRIAHVQQQAVAEALQLLTGAAVAAGDLKQQGNSHENNPHMEMPSNKPQAIGAASPDEADSTPLQSPEGPALAQLCLILTSLRKDTSYCAWAVDNIPNLDHPTLAKLASQAKCGGPTNRYWERIDQGMSGIFGARWVCGPCEKPQGLAAPPKCMYFVLDASGSMSGSFLRTCKGSIHTIVDNFCSDDDQVGFLAFAHYTKYIFDIMPKKGNTAYIHEQISQVQTFGGTAFYDAVLDATAVLNKVDPGMPKWIIALTDGADSHSSRDGPRPIAGAQGCQAIGKIPNINIACITVGQLPRETIDTVTRYGDAARRTGGKGIHVVAQNSEAIAKAFEDIGNMMADDGLAEHL